LQATLNDSAHIRLGGLQIEMLPTFGPCTIGINVNGGTGFLTASHCTEKRGPDPTYNVTQTEAFQPTVSSGNYLGTEVDDPAWFALAPDNCCIFAEPKCRYSDVARLAYEPAFTPLFAGELKIEKTTYAGTGTAQEGSKVISGTLEILGEMDGWDEGKRIDKIGAVTGWTYGIITNPCEDYRTLDNYYLLCQARVTGGYANQGDSGAPAFWLEAGASTAYWAGILAQGGVDRNGNSFFMVSRNNDIHDELSSFTIFH
jgi:hypothetical protein